MSRYIPKNNRPERRPEAGICLPCRVHRVIDGDTVDVVMLTGLVWRVRVSGIDCPERNTPEGKEATAATEAFLKVAEEAGQLFCSMTGHENIGALVRNGAPLNLLHELTQLQRIEAHLWLDEETTLTDALRAAGHVKRTTQ